jgi:hexosaminidase
MIHHRSSGIGFGIVVGLLAAKIAGAAINIVPQVNSLTPGTGVFNVAATDNISIYADAQSDATFPWAAKLFRNMGIAASKATSAAGAKVTITMAPDAAVGAEGYKLNITATGVSINAPTLAGQFYAIQTLRQLFPNGVEDSVSGTHGAFSLPQLSITDKPRFEYRGIMLDPVRKFLPIPYLYQQIDRMSLYKMNRIHLLISNDQGFRVESKAWPLLHEKGSTTNCGGQHPAAGERWYYTQDEMRAIVKYATQRHIKIIPEIDMPGHCTAICYCYPNMGTPNNAIQTNEDVGKSIMYSSGANASYVNDFIGKLWRDMATVFTSDQFQIGGDECFSISAANFKAFALRVQDTLSNIGKKAIAWDEIGAAGALRDGNWSQDWHANSSIGQITSSCTYLYFDMANKKGDPSTNNWCVQELSIQGVYGTRFSSSSLKGVEATLFTERVSKYPEYWDRQIWPRSTALAEVGWVANNNDLSGFVGRVASQGSRMHAMGIGYYNAPGISWDAGTQNAKMTTAFSGFDPTVGSTAIITRNSRKVDAQRGLLNRGGREFDVTGRTIRVTPMGFPESINGLKAP